MGSARTGRIVVGLISLTAALGGCTRLREIAETRGIVAPSGAGASGEGTASTGDGMPGAHDGAAASPASPPDPRSPSAGGTLLAFPGAEGFGATARGGRGGALCRVTTLAARGPGSLQACFDAKGPRTVVFDVSGTIAGPLEIHHGALTIAGQSSPGGITVKGGVVCDNVYDPNDCNDVVIRHVRFRDGAPDALRLGGAHDVIVDHCSFSGAEDENVEITRSRNVTIQHSVIAEPHGDHYQWGGVLINYSTDRMPLDAITIHHTVWNGVAGRLPEISCEENGDGPGRTNCTGRVVAIELANNVLWDASDPIWWNRCTGNNAGNDCAPTAPSFAVRLNLVGNVMARRSSADPDAPLAEPALFGGVAATYAADNVVSAGARTSRVAAGRVPSRHPFPAITYTPASGLVALLARTAGAFPRDRMDTRLASYLARPVDARPASWRSGKGIDVGDADGNVPAAALPADADRDGIPDAWESAHGLDPKVGDATSFGRARGCAAGYSALECYLNELADARVGLPR